MTHRCRQPGARSCLFPSRRAAQPSGRPWAAPSRSRCRRSPAPTPPRPRRPNPFPPSSHCLSPSLRRREGDRREARRVSGPNGAPESTARGAVGGDGWSTFEDQRMWCKGHRNGRDAGAGANSVTCRDPEGRAGPGRDPRGWEGRAGSLQRTHCGRCRTVLRAFRV